MSSTPAFGPLIRGARLGRRISLRQLATDLGISPASLSQIETGRTTLSAPRLHEILRVLDLSLGDLLDGHGEPAAPPTSSGSTWRSFAPLAWDPVLTAALEAFVAVGYHGATVRDIAKRCGLSVPGIYHHYPSKQHMLAAILDRTMEDLLGRSAAARDEGADPVERFARIIECLVLYHTYRQAPAFIGASEMRSLDPPARRRIASRRAAQQRMIDVEVDAGVTAGRFRTGNPHDAARAAVTMCVSVTQWYRPQGPLTPEQIAARYVGFALHLMDVHDK